MLWDGGVPPSLSLSMGRLPAESNKGLCWLAPLNSLCSYSYNGKELGRVTCTLLKVFVSAGGGVADTPAETHGKCRAGGDIMLVCLKHQ